MTTLDAGRELDALVAEKVMGWTLINYETYQPAVTPQDYADAANNDGWTWQDKDGLDMVCDEGGSALEAHQWEPSTSIAAAWQVVAKADEVEIWNHTGTAYGCRLIFGEKDGLAKAETAPLAICRAALNAVGSQEL